MGKLPIILAGAATLVAIVAAFGALLGHLPPRPAQPRKRSGDVLPLATSDEGPEDACREGDSERNGTGD